MPTIRAVTSFMDSRLGKLSTGDTAEVSGSVAKEMVEEKGYAEYVDSPTPKVEIDGVKFPKSFVEKSLPEKFPHVELLREQDIKTFGDLAHIRDYTDIKEIGQSRAEDVKEGVKKVLRKMRQ